MSMRIVVADQAEARLYDLRRRDTSMLLVRRLNNPAARLHDRDLKSDRPGRVYDRPASAGTRRGAVQHHATGGERRPRRIESERFARKIAEELERGRGKREFDRLAIVSGQPFRGILLAALGKRLKAMPTTIVAKDLVHDSESQLRGRLSRKLSSSERSSRYEP
jgi:protein required for attachment to host cells